MCLDRHTPPPFPPVTRELKEVVMCGNRGSQAAITLGVTGPVATATAATMIVTPVQFALKDHYK